MQFHKHGPDIPERFLRAHEEGRVIFFCGAGVSVPRGLPGFKDLAVQIFSAVGELPDALERTAIKGHQYDRAIGLLENRILDGRGEVRQHLVGLLQAHPLRPRQFDTHSSLLILATGRSGDLRLVTTNFDTLFDESLKTLGIRAASHYAPFLPVPKNRWQGIVYLHGGLAAPHSAGRHDEIVLSSGDFGLAYLSERWAARFVSDLFRNFVVCFVGYSLTDPVLRYMVDAIAADDQRGESSPDVFAFSQFSRGQERTVEAEWRARRVTPILYKAYHNHRNLHQTLSEWAGVYRDGVAGKERIVAQYAHSMPFVSTHEDNFAGRVVWALSEPHGGPAKLFADIDPPPVLAWLEPLLEKGLRHTDLAQYGVTPDPTVDDGLAFALLQRPAPYRLAPWMSVSAGGHGSDWDRVMMHLARWLCRHLNDPKLFVWIVQRLPIHSAMAREVRASLNTADISPRMKIFWELLLAGMIRSPQRWPSFYEWQERLRAVGLTINVRRQLLALLEPRLKVSESRYWNAFGEFGEGAEPGDPAERLDVEIALAGEDLEHVYALVRNEQSWLIGLPGLVGDLSQVLLNLLDLLAEIGKADDGSDLSYLARPTIEEHEQNQSLDEWQILITILRDAWLALAEVDPQAAKRTALSWQDKGYPLFQRLALFAARDATVFSPTEALSVLLSDGGRWLWSIETRREALRLLVVLTPTLSLAQRTELEGVLMMGFPPAMLRDDIGAQERQRVLDRELWLRLAKVSRASALLSLVVRARLQELSELYPEWDLTPNERDEFAVWIGGGDYDRQIRKPPRTRRDLVESLRADVTPRIDDGLWFERAKSDYPRSAIALLELARQGEWPSRGWGGALNAWAADEKIAVRTWRRVAGTLSVAPDDTIKQLATSLGWYLETVAKKVEDDSGHLMTLIGRVTELSADDDRSSDGDPVNVAINHPVGRVTEALVFWWQRQNLVDGVGLGDAVREQFAVLFDDQRPGLLHGRVVLASRIVTLYRVDEAWTREHLIERLSWSRDAREARALWCGVLWPARLYGPLLDAFKLEFLSTATHYASLDGMGQQYAALLVLAAVDYPDVVGRRDAASAFNELPSEALEKGARFLVRLQESATGQTEESWINRVRPFITSIWPKSAQSHTSAIGNLFARLALATGSEFSTAVQFLGRWIRGAARPSAVLHLLEESKLTETQPDGVLQFLDLLYEDDVDYRGAQLLGSLHDLQAAAPHLADDPRMRRLLELASRGT